MNSRNPAQATTPEEPFLPQNEALPSGRAPSPPYVNLNYPAAHI